MLGLRWGAHASYSPHRAGLQGPRSTSQDPGIQLMVGALWDGHCLPRLVQGWLRDPGSGVMVPGWGVAFGCGLCRMGLRAFGGSGAVGCESYGTSLGRRFRAQQSI